MIRASSILFWFSLTIIASVGLYHTSYRVHDLSQQLHDLNASIEQEQLNIHVLKAEWVYLANPTRIEQAARKYLALHPTNLRQVARIDNLPELAPTRAEATATVTISGTPIASVKTTLPAQMVAHNEVRSDAKRHAAADDDHNHINTHMVMQHTASVTPLAQTGHLILANYGAHQ